MNIIQVDFWHVMELLLGFISVLLVFGKMLISKIDKHMERLDSRIEAVEKDIAAHKARLPLEYQLRADAIRNDTVSHAKLDALNNRIERLMERLP